MTHLRRFLMVLSCVAGLGAPPAPAADLSFFAGRMNPGKLQLDVSRAPQALKGTPIYGFRFGHSFLPLIGLDHTLGFSSELARPQDFVTRRDINGYIYSSNLTVRAPLGRTSPFVTAGVGFVRQSGSDRIFGTQFAVNYGGGIKFHKLLGPLGLRIDARGYTATGILSTKLNFFEISAGPMLSIGH